MTQKKLHSNSGQRPAQQAKKRLRLIVALIFAGLALPVYLLFDKVYTQLENETFYAYRAQAEEMAARMQERLQEIFAPEDQRPFAQYSFFNVQENPLLQSKGVNFSPLSKLPPDSNVPGIVGYFQLNPDGSFHSPVLPDLNEKGSTQDIGGLSRSELERRKKQTESLRKLLTVSQVTNARAHVSDKISDPPREEMESRFRESAKQKRSARGDDDKRVEFDQMFDAEDTGQSADSAAKKDDPKNKTGRDAVASARSGSNQKPLDKSKLGKLNIDPEIWAKKARPAPEKTRRHGEKSDRYGMGIGSRRKERVEIPDQAAAGKYFRSLADQSAPKPASPTSASNSNYAIPYASIRTETQEEPKKQNEARISAPGTNRSVRILNFESEIDSLRTPDLMEITLIPI